MMNSEDLSRLATIVLVSIPLIVLAIALAAAVGMMVNAP
jgi:hypothetical protein